MSLMIIHVTLCQTSACTVSTVTVKVINTLSYFFRKTITYAFSFSLKIPMTRHCGEILRDSVDSQIVR